VVIVQRLAAIVNPTGDLCVLDAGCGTGLYGPLLKWLGARLVGVDLSAGMLAEALKRKAYDSGSKLSSHTT
jgi:predicted TPR repeat methyltransferase